MHKHETNIPFKSLHDWEIDSLFVTKGGEVIKMLESTGYMYRCAVMDGLNVGPTRMYWFNGIHSERTGEGQDLDTVLYGCRLPTPRLQGSYYDLAIGSVLLLSNRDIVVVTKHFCTEDGTKSIGCLAVAAVPDKVNVVDPSVPGKCVLTKYGYGLHNTDIYVVSVLYEVKPEEVFSALTLPYSVL